MRKFTALVLILIMVCLSGCGIITFHPGGLSGENTDDGSSGNHTVTTAEYPYKKITSDGLSAAQAMLETVFDYDYEGITVFIKTPSPDVFKPNINAGEETPDAYSAALYKRNAMVEEKLHCRILYTEAKIEAMETELKSAIASGTYYSELVAIPQSHVASFAAKGYLLNIKTLPYMNTDAPYFYPGATSALTAGHSIYGTGSFATSAPGDLYGVFMNIDALGANAAKHIYQLVKSGRWTWDELYQSAQAARIDGGTSLALGGDLSKRTTFIDIVTASSGEHFVNNEQGTTPTLSLPKSAPDMVRASAKLIAGNFVFTAMSAEQTSFKMFNTGKAVFFIDRLSVMPSLSDSPVNWSVVPIPLLSADQTGYSTLVPDNSLVFAVPATITNTSGASALMQAISAASYEYIPLEYLDYQMKFVLRNNASANMLDIILRSPYYDFSRVFGTNSASLRQGTYECIRDAATTNGVTVGGLFDKRVKKANEDLKRNYGISP